MRQSANHAFTLIEVLVVVGILTVLTLIAIPHYQNAQVRARISRALSDMRTVGTALEAYSADCRDYPPNSFDGLAILPHHITTPISYLTHSDIRDPFANAAEPSIPERTHFLTYNRIVTNAQRLALAEACFPPPMESIDHPAFNPGAFEKYGQWRLVSKGPDRIYADQERFPRSMLYGSDLPYDSTNGTISFGNLFRLHNDKAFPDLSN